MGEYVTLEDLRKVTGDDVDRNVIDEFAKSILLSRTFLSTAPLPRLAVAPAYTYTRQTTQGNAAPCPSTRTTQTLL